MSKFITDIQPEIAAPPVAPPPGGGTLVYVMFRNVTEVLCPDNDTWLLDARAVTRDGDELIVLDESGTTIGRLRGEE